MASLNRSGNCSVEEVEKIRRDWIRTQNEPFSVLYNPRTNGEVFWAALSKNLELSDSNDNGKIIVFSQYYIDSNEKRAKEISRTLMLQASNESIDTIYLLNERIYTPEEMGFKTPKEKEILNKKIVQVEHGIRMTFKAVFDYVDLNKLEGHIVICNSDIFFDKSIENIKKLEMSTYKRALCLLRYEYNGEKSLKDCKLFGPRGDSQDTWVIHSKNIPSVSHRKPFEIALGIPGCDNKMTYLLQVCGIECFNQPELVRTFHYHRSQKRNYDASTKRIPAPWVSLIPIVPDESNDLVAHSYNLQYENDNIFNYVSGKLERKEPFIMPRIAGIENNLAYFAMAVTHGLTTEKDFMEKNGARLMQIMKNNAGVKLETFQEIKSYSNLYLDAFKRCDTYFDWEPWGNVYPGIRDSHNFVTENFKKDRIWSLALDIFHNIHRKPWTWSLKGKRILIVSAFVESIEKKIDQLPNIYGVDLFPDCSFVFLKPPQTQGRNSSRSFKEELGLFASRIIEIRDTFDVALVSCGGYGNPLMSILHENEISAIYVGGVLQMYFGVYGARWLRERPDIMRLYLNKHWSRPTLMEKPSGHNQVEGSCYW
jgi:hypothetical protein